MRCKSLAAVVLCLAACETKDEDAGKPTTFNLQITPSTVPVGIATPMAGGIDVEDPDGDLATLHFQMVKPDGSRYPELDTPIVAGGQTSGRLPFAFDFTADQVGRHSLEVWVVDAAGHASTRLGSSFEAEAVSPTPALSNLSATVVDAFVGRSATATGQVAWTDGDADITTLVVNVVAFDTTVIATARVPVTAAATGSASFAIDFIPEDTGTHTLTLQAEDAGGHTSNTLQQTFTVSTSPTVPELRNLDIGDGHAWIDLPTPFPITADFVDSDGNVTTLFVTVKMPDGTTLIDRQITLDVGGQTSGAISTEVVITARVTGRYTLSASLGDAAGERSHPLSLTFDAVAPSSTAPVASGLVLDAPVLTVGAMATLEGAMDWHDVSRDVARLLVDLRRPDGSRLGGVDSPIASVDIDGTGHFMFVVTPDVAGFHAFEAWFEDAEGQPSVHLTRTLEVRTSPTAPDVSALDLHSSRALVGIASTIHGSLDYSDSDANIQTLHVRVTEPSGAELSATTFPVNGATAGTLDFDLPVNAQVPGRHTLEAWLVDAAGQASPHLTRGLDALDSDTTPTISDLVLAPTAPMTKRAFTLSGEVAYVDPDANTDTLQLRVLRPNGSELTSRQVAVTSAVAAFAFDLTPDVVGRYTLEAWLVDEDEQASPHDTTTFDVVDSAPAIVKVTAIYPSLFVTQAETLEASVDYRDADADAETLHLQLVRPDGSRFPETTVAIASDATRETIVKTLSFTPDVAGKHTLEAWVDDALGQTSVHTSTPIDVFDATQTQSPCSALNVDCSGEGFCYDVDDTTCAYFESHELEPPETCDGISGTEPVCVSSTTDLDSPLVTDQNRCHFVQFWSYPTDLPMDCRCPEARMDQRCVRPYEVPNAVSYGSGPRMRSLAATMQAWRGTVVGREWFLPVKWSTFDHPNETMIFAIDLDTGNRRYVSGAYDDPGLGYTSVGDGPAFVQVIDLKLFDGQLYAVGATSDIAAPKLWRVDPTSGDRTLLFDEASAPEAQLCPNFSTLPGRKTVQMATQGWTMDAQGRFYFSNVNMPGPSILRLTVAGVGGATATQCEYLTRVVDCPTCSTQQNVGAGFSTIQFDFTAFEIKDTKLYAVSDKRFIEVDLTSGNRRQVSFASDIGALGNGPINGEGLADRWTTWDPYRGLFWTVGILGGSMAVTVDPTTGDRAAWPCMHETRGLLEACGGTGMALVPGPLNFGGMVIDPNPPHDLYFAHDLMSVVKYEVKTGNAFIFSL